MRILPSFHLLRIDTHDATCIRTRYDNELDDHDPRRGSVAFVHDTNVFTSLSRHCADTGVPFSVFQSVPNTNFQTAVYVFAIHPTTQMVHFAFGRKVPPKTRVPYGWTRANNAQPAPASVLVGAAGTDAKYHGKWASLGGGADKTARSPLEAAVIELNDEADIKPSFDRSEEHTSELQSR